MAANESPNPEDAFRLREYFGALWSRKWSIIALTLIGVLASGAYTYKTTPVYTSTISVLATNPTATIDQTGGVKFPPNMDVERSLITAYPVAACATQILSHLADDHIGADLSTICSPDTLAKTVPAPKIKQNLTVSFVQGSTVLNLADTEPSRKLAQAKVQAFALAYVNYKITLTQASLAARRVPVNTQIAVLDKSLASANVTFQKHIAAAAAAGGQCFACTADAQKIAVIQQQIGQFQQQLLSLSDTNITPPQVLAPAIYPLQPSSPNKKLNIGLGIFVGLALGIGLALLRERLDDRLRSRADLEDNAGVPVLAVIPKVPGWRKKSDARLVTATEPKSAVAEAYRTLRTGILFASVQRGIKTVMVCSPLAGDGKTTTATNLAVVLADGGKRVILLSADLRKPRVHQFFGMENDKGVSNILAGELQPWESLGDQTIDNLRVLPSGPVPAKPAELLGSERMGELIAGLREVADFVIIDTAPVLLVADAAALSPLVDAVLLVANAENSTRSAVAHARERFEQVDAPLIGAVLNNFDPTRARAYTYRYRYGYGYRYRTYGGYGGYGYREYADEPPPNGDAGRRAEPPARVPPSQRG